MPLRTDAISRFLHHHTHADLAALYNYNMEVQINVAQDGGQRIEGEYLGRPWHGWTDGLTTWKPFRIPWKAYSDPEYVDSEMPFDLDDHCEAIGLTGWDWASQLSKWVAFDFDALVGHSEKHPMKLDPAQLTEVREAATNIPWVTIRKSTSGTGLHIYVFLEPVPTSNHHEHAALARAVLGKMAALTGFDFQTKVDICGGNMWVWHRKMLNTDGLMLIKQGTTLADIPPNWRDHIKVITGRQRRTRITMTPAADDSDRIDELSGRQLHVALDDEHKKLLSYLEESGACWWWDSDHHMLITHTFHLKEAHTELKLRGCFETLAQGTEKGADHNCFCYPMRKGAWSVRRYTPGVQEHASWDQDGSGWTRTYLNKELDFVSACKSKGGLEDQNGAFLFREGEQAAEAARLLGVELNLPPAMLGRETTLKIHKSGRLVAEVTRNTHDTADGMPGWLAKGNKPWIKLFNVQIAMAPNEPELGAFDDVTRHLVTELNEDYGWVIKSEADWRQEPLTHVKMALTSMGYRAQDINQILGSSVFQAWTIVNKPFQTEYPGGRQWNRNAAQFRYLPTKDKTELSYPHWLKILEHCGRGLDDAIKENPWAKVNGIISGADYLKCWIASIFQEPQEPLPYLFLWGNENCGKSILHEALSLLVTKGYQKADLALTSQSGFNGELEGAIICVIEEVDLSASRTALNRIKDWVTSPQLNIRHMYRMPYHIPNTTHWIQCANKPRFCPIFPGDTRITMIRVENLDPLELIPKRQLMQKLEAEASDFLAAVTSLEIPPSNDRLNVPVILTEEKTMVQELNQTPLERFLYEQCVTVPGRLLKFSTFYERYIKWLDPEDMRDVSKIKVGREVSMFYPKGRLHGDSQFHIGNICFRDSPDPTPAGATLKLINGYLESVGDENDS